MKIIRFVGASLSDLRDFPKAARQRAGYQLHRAQNGLEPDDWKPMRTVGPGVREIRITAGGAFRVIYLAAIGDAVYVLHAFEKKSRKTAKADMAVARRRYKDLMAEKR